MDAEQTIYFSSSVPEGLSGGDLYKSRQVDGHWMKPENLGPAINTDKGEGMPFISPDGSYLLFSRDYDLHISFRAKDGIWHPARKLPPPINSPSIEICPIVSPDGRYLFSISQRGGESRVCFENSPSRFFELFEPWRLLSLFDLQGSKSSKNLEENCLFHASKGAPLAHEGLVGEGRFHRAHEESIGQRLGFGSATGIRTLV
jgi:hypothetical protein